ncbi:cysteinyl-tRNA synthetase [Sphingomonas guangdongensis]|uniref:Cysteine--tRNA ligase n=1 Tax=Sphingomonas guangdongensis TaxID=1141890 RepID=A0A285R1Z8_9SPHN|nr:cysteine--tRNA ligase [Sphingomonas guangdongensis]SOB88136.1 cysteinyl-tRNA synthetase [Sphingomonas guangdongensis]
MPLTLYNSLTRSLQPFTPIRPGEARVYTCGPTVYNYQHIGNMRAFLFADTLGRALRSEGYALTHIINITDVGHLTSDADEGEDKMERAAATRGQSIWEIAAHYTDAFKRDVARLNIVAPAEWTVATDFVPEMIEFARAIEGNCYLIEGGLYFDVSRVPDYGALARAATDEGESRIDPVSGKRNPQDFAIWRRSPPGEQRQMEWDSPWGRGAPGWHLECSVMSRARLGHPFDIHTGGIDHREIHHPNEIAQNQAFCGCDDPGARWWMHNNFLVDRRGKMSKSTGEFLTLQRLVDAGYHPLAYRLLCLQAHYRSELEFSWDNLQAAFTRLKRLVQAVERLRARCEAEPAGDRALPEVAEARAAIADDLNTARALVALETVVAGKRQAGDRLAAAIEIDRMLGLGLDTLTRADLRVRPAAATIEADAVEQALAARKDARAAKDFARSDAIRDKLSAHGVEVMDGDPLGWEWKPDA